MKSFKPIKISKPAEIADQYLAKGLQVYFEGKLQTRKWQDKKNQKTAGIIIKNLYLGRKDMVREEQPCNHRGQWIHNVVYYAYLINLYRFKLHHQLMSTDKIVSLRINKNKFRIEGEV